MIMACPSIIHRRRPLLSHYYPMIIPLLSIGADHYYPSAPTIILNDYGLSHYHPSAPTRIIFGLFRIISDYFRIMFGSFRIIIGLLDNFGLFSDYFGLSQYHPPAPTRPPPWRSDLFSTRIYIYIYIYI